MSNQNQNQIQQQQQQRLLFLPNILDMFVHYNNKNYSDTFESGLTANQMIGGIEATWYGLDIQGFYLPNINFNTLIANTYQMQLLTIFFELQRMTSNKELNKICQQKRNSFIDYQQQYQLQDLSSEDFHFVQIVIIQRKFKRIERQIREQEAEVLFYKKKSKKLNQKLQKQSQRKVVWQRIKVGNLLNKMIINNIKQNQIFIFSGCVLLMNN